MSRMGQEADLWRYVDQRGPDECWPWLGYKTGRGYGRMRIRTRQTMAHRVAWVLATGTDPGDLLVCHRCDNPPCCNPDHLFLGTIADNNRDAQQKGRLVSVRGSRHGSAKLTEESVSRIRERHQAGEPTRTLAQEFDVALTTIREIITRKCWGHVA